jgi:NAD-reducing hydrogenase large subunit
MARKVVIDPVTRIEGHAKITIHLGDDGNVSDAEFHVAEFRGFEKFCEGRPFAEMPSITARICGICPVSHHLASAKAGDRILATTIPPAANKLRNLMNLGQLIQSHALSFFHLSSPDLLLGWDSPQAKRNVFGLIAANPDLARAGIRLRQFGQEIIEMLGGKKIHCAWAVPGGVREPLTEENRQRMLAWLPESFKTAQTGLALFKDYMKAHQQEVQIFGNFPSLFMSLVREDGTWEHHDGVLRIVDSNGNIIVDQYEPEDYKKFLGEAVHPTSYLKSPYYRPFGYPDGIYRVGPLARLNVAHRMGTPLADKELTEFRKLGSISRTSSFLYHYARLIEILASLERVQALMDDPEILSTHLRADAGVNRLEAVGVSEAPRGTLFHHYKVDQNGILERINLIVATGNNNLAMNRTVAQIARHYIHDGKNETIPEPLLNRVEHGIRCYDPCLSCSTHALGQMPMEISLVAPDGRVLDRKMRQ